MDGLLGVCCHIPMSCRVIGSDSDRISMARTVCSDVHRCNLCNSVKRFVMARALSYASTLPMKSLDMILPVDHLGDSSSKGAHLDDLSNTGSLRRTLSICSKDSQLRLPAMSSQTSSRASLITEQSPKRWSRIICRSNETLSRASCKSMAVCAFKSSVMPAESLATTH